MTDPLRAALAEAREAIDAALGLVRGDGPPNWDWLREVVKEIDAALSTPPTPTGAEIDDAWPSIETAPKDGTHILARRCPLGAEWNDYTNPPTVVHWFDDPQEPGFYTSVNELAPEHPFEATHWYQIPKGPGPARHIPRPDIDEKMLREILAEEYSKHYEGFGASADRINPDSDFGVIALAAMRRVRRLASSPSAGEGKP
jgi:hypothetical protein